MKNKLIAFFVSAVIFAVGVFAIPMLNGTVTAVAANTGQEELQQQINELRQLIELLLQLQTSPAPAATQQPVAPAQQGSIAIPANVVPRPPARTGGPLNPAISAQRAVELSRDFLVANGVTNAWFDYVYMDVEQGVWVWSVEFDGPGRSFEFYVNLNSGAFVQTPWGVGTSSPAPIPVPAPAPVPVPAPAGNWSPSPGNWQSPSPGGGNWSPSPGNWSSPSPGGWSSPSPGGWSWSTWMRWGW